MAHKHPINSFNPYSIFIPLVVSALLLASCGPLAAVPTIAATPVPPSPTPLVGSGTPTATVPSSPTPQVVLLDTPTPQPSPTPLMVQTVLATPVLPTPSLAPAATPSSNTFALITGTTAGVIQGTVLPGQVLAYTLGAGQAEPLTLIMTSPNNDVTLGVFEANNNILLDPAKKLRGWNTVLPATEQYTIEVIGGATSESFSLSIKLPVVVSFAAGANSTSLNGTTVNGYLFSYALNCAAGQTMSAALAQPASTATIDIYGLSSGMLVDATAGYTSWSGVLPQTQDYIVEVVPTNNHVINYNLTVSCTGTPGNAYSPSGNPSTGGQLYFLPGETMSVVQGTIQPGQIATYSVQANQYQPLMLVLGSPNGDAVLGVIDPLGNRLLDPANQYTYWQWQLPLTGLYTIQVVGGIEAESFTLTTKVGKLYTYPASGSSLKIYATTVRGLIKSYAFRLSTGISMTVSLNVDPSIAHLDIFGVQTGSILNSSDKVTSWTGSIPSTQEYVVEVIPGGTMSAYTLTISNP